MFPFLLRLFNQSLTGIDGSSVTFNDNDVLMELGKLNISEISEDYPLPQKILIKDAMNIGNASFEVSKAKDFDSEMEQRA